MSEQPTADARDAGKRPYERPGIAWEEDFEPYVFSMCSKNPGQGGVCATMKSS